MDGGNPENVYFPAPHSDRSLSPEREDSPFPAPESGQAQSPEYGQAHSPESGQAQSPEYGQAQSPELENGEVMSEVHLGCPPYFSGPFVSHFTFLLPLPQNNDVDSSKHIVDLDEDGDLIVTRRTNQASYSDGVTIKHNIKSTIPSVGLQVWRAELVLADFVLHKMLLSSEFHGVVAIELGAGTGLVGILVARAADSVFISDHGIEVLDNCASNAHVNSGLFRRQCSVKVRELDWLKPWPPLDLESETRYSWTSSEVDEIRKVSVLLAADVIYSDELTDAFFGVLEKLMGDGSKKLYLALEKRYNFSLSDLDIVANGYSHFLSYLRNAEGGGFVGRQIDLSEIPQYVREYERGEEVELWEIKYLRKKH